MGISFTSHITKDTDSIHADLGPSACDSCLKKKKKKKKSLRSNNTDSTDKQGEKKRAPNAAE